MTHKKKQRTRGDTQRSAPEYSYFYQAILCHNWNGTALVNKDSILGDIRPMEYLFCILPMVWCASHICINIMQSAGVVYANTLFRSGQKCAHSHDMRNYLAFICVSIKLHKNDRTERQKRRLKSLRTIDGVNKEIYMQKWTSTRMRLCYTFVAWLN